MIKKNSVKPAKNVATIVLAGGEGTRLKPLTQIRCKPAVTFGGRYRIIDVAISNAINSGFHDIYVLSQFLASTLNNYLLETFPTHSEGYAHVEVLSPEDSPHGNVWYKGTADAVRQNLAYLLKNPAEYFVILSGDQLYSMDLKDMLEFAIEKDAELTIATIPVNEQEATRMGVMKIDNQFEITDFFEKPQDQETIQKFAIAPEIAKKHDALDDLSFLGSMGIYIFKRQALIDLLTEDPREDFGKHLIPTQMNKGKTFAYIFDGYWEDIGTISSYYNANLSLVQNRLCLDLYNKERPIFTQNVTLPSSRITDTSVSESIICDGCVVKADEISRCMIGLNTEIGENTVLRDSILVGWFPHSNREPIHIGSNCRIEKAIIDEGTVIGNNVELVNKKNLESYDDPWLSVREGILVVKAGAQIPNNFVF